MDLKAFKKDAYVGAKFRNDEYRVGVESSITLTYDCDRFYVSDQEIHNTQAQVRLDEGGTVYLSARTQLQNGETLSLPFDEFVKALRDLIVQKKLEAQQTLKQKGKK
jgi:hypothetical protein